MSGTGTAVGSVRVLSEGETQADAKAARVRRLRSCMFFFFP